MTILPQVEQQLLRGIERRARQPHRRLLARLSLLRRGLPLPPSPRPVRRRLALVLLPLAVVAALLGFMLAGGEGHKRFDVLAAVYRALTLGPGVHYSVIETVYGFGNHHSRELDRRWSTFSPPRERAVGRTERNSGPERLFLSESAIKPGGTWMSWSTFNPYVIEQTKAKGILKAAAQPTSPGVIRAAYLTGHLRLVEKTRFRGREVYRLEVGSPDSSPARGSRTNSSVELFDAKTFLPISVDYGRDRHGRLVPNFVMRYLVYRELPPTPQNLALLNMKPHPGTRIVERR